MNIEHRTSNTERRSLAFLFITLFAASTFAAAEIKIRVTADRVNLRSRPSEQSEVVFQVSEDDILTLKDLSDDWVAIVPPAGVSLWVYGELVRDGVVAASTVLVRTGPGINYKAIGRLEKGEKVSDRGSYEDWLKIAPPAGCVLWISHKYVEPVAYAAKKPQFAPPAPPARRLLRLRPAERGEVGSPAQRDEVGREEVERPVEPVLRAAPKRQREGGSVVEGPVRKVSSPQVPAGLSRAELVPSAEQGKRVEYVGVLRSSGLVWRRPSKYRLVKRDKKGRAITVCYILWNESRLSSVLGRTLRVYGREYWVQAVRYPVVVPERIVKHRTSNIEHPTSN